MITYNPEEFKFHIQQIDVGRVLALSELVHLCTQSGIEIEKVNYFQNGFQVMFKDIPGDAILHDGSYGRFDNKWETMYMPWDGDDVSVHDTKTLANLLKALKNGADWTEFDN